MSSVPKEKEKGMFVIISRISRVSRKLTIIIPKEYYPQLEKYHGKRVRVYIELLE